MKAQPDIEIGSDWPADASAGQESLLDRTSAVTRSQGHRMVERSQQWDGRISILTRKA
jgi:hypothetical protein